MKKNLNDYLQSLSPERRKIIDERAARMLAEELTDYPEKPQFRTDQFELDAVDSDDIEAS